MIHKKGPVPPPEKTESLVQLDSTMLLRLVRALERQAVAQERALDFVHKKDQAREEKAGEQKN